MNARLARKSENENIWEQLSLSPFIHGKTKDIVSKFLTEHSIVSLEYLTLEDLYLFRESIKNSEDIPERCKSYYASLLEQVYYSYKNATDVGFSTRYNCINDSSHHIIKVSLFLSIIGIRNIDDIDVDARQAYSDYLRVSVAPSKHLEYLKTLDKLKLSAIKENNSRFAMSPTYKYGKKKVFLPYNDNYEIAKSFYYQQDKNRYLFDFSIEAPEVMKKQVFDMLNHVLKTVTDSRDRRSRFLAPLQLLYMYCVENNVEDIQMLTAMQIEEIKDSMKHMANSATQIIYNTQYFLFMNAKSINWNANIWHLDRFYVEQSRVNPARPRRKIRFDDIAIEENRNLFKEYMKYLLGVSCRRALATIWRIYYSIHSFLIDLDADRQLVFNMSEDNMRKYINYIDAKNWAPHTYNIHITSIARFYAYLMANGYIKSLPIYFAYYLKKVPYLHNDRCVDLQMQKDILNVLGTMPIEYRLIYLNLWCVGLRVSEVCSLKGNAYSFDGTDAWIRVCQFKMKFEKVVPIPTKLYEIMGAYIRDNNIKADDYIFKNRKGDAFDASLFSKNFRKYLVEAGITEYMFRSHDFRHGVATNLYNSGVPIEVIRDYLGHKDSDMTRKYIDYLPDILDKCNDDYFDQPENRLECFDINEV